MVAWLSEFLSFLEPQMVFEMNLFFKKSDLFFKEALDLEGNMGGRRGPAQPEDREGPEHLVWTPGVTAVWPDVG